MGARREAWERILGQYKSSGLSPVAFCKQHDLRTGLFYAWRSKLLREQNPEPGSFVELTPTAKSDPAGDILEIQLGTARVRFPWNGQTGQLSTLLKAVREVAC